VDEQASPPNPTLRDLTRDAVRFRISDVALRLIDERGFDHVTVEQIASVVGISTRSFNRYFPTKEDAVLGDLLPWGEHLRTSFVGRPRDEPIWQGLQSAFLSLLDLAERDPERRQRVTRVVTSSPALRGRSAEKQLLWAAMLTPVVADRLSGEDAALRAEALVRAALTCFDVGLSSSVGANESRAASDLVALAFDELKLTA